jgi:hypothetical protein
LNPFYKDFKNAIERLSNEKLSGLQIVFKANIKPQNAHSGCYNAPTKVAQVGAIIPGYGNEKKNIDIVLYFKKKLHHKNDYIKHKNGKKKQKLVFISEGHPMYDPAHYVLMFPYGTYGWGLDTIFSVKGYNQLSWFP